MNIFQLIYWNVFECGNKNPVASRTIIQEAMTPMVHRMYTPALGLEVVDEWEIGISITECLGLDEAKGAVEHIFGALTI